MATNIYEDASDPHHKNTGPRRGTMRSGTFLLKTEINMGRASDSHHKSKNPRRGNKEEFLEKKL